MTNFVIWLIINIFNIKMKGINMQVPDLEQIYNQKCHYQQHKQKLLQIYESRKSQLGIDSNRATQFESFRQKKIKSFVQKFNKNSEDIAKNNLKLLTKLENVRSSVAKSSVGKSSQSESKCPALTNSFFKKRNIETEKQNLRMNEKVKSASSCLSQQKLGREYQRSKQIRNRIMRYTSQQSGVFLKSSKYFEERNERNSSQMSNKSTNLKKSNTAYESLKMPRKQFFNKSVASYYQKENILKNKVDTTQSSLASIKLKAKFRSNTSIQANPEKYGSDREENAFFPTQPKKNRVIRFMKTKC